jgi:putative component of toxin-antitoxin plasmid stabilization module
MALAIVYILDKLVQGLYCLCAGDKGSQERDIQLAKSYWRDYAKRKGTG